MSHTPGPWLVDDDGCIWKPDREGEDNVARVEVSRDEWPANALLIAAAPELLEALEMCVPLLWQEFSGISPDLDGPVAIRAADAAIAKATGNVRTPS